MALRLRRWPHGTVALFIGSVLWIATYNFFIFRGYMAHRFSARADQASLVRGVDLEPRDARIHDLLGRYLLFNAQDPSAAVVAMRQAVALNPYNASYWLDLAQGDLTSGAQTEYKHAINRALAADPTTPEVAWNAANLMVFQGDIEHALPEYAVVFNHSPRLVPAALSQCWQIFHSTDKIFPILPRDPFVYLQFLHLLTSAEETDAAAQVWTALLGMNKKFDFHDGLFYIDYLLGNRKVEQAAEAWRQLSLSSPQLASYSQPGNLVVDGTFSENILNAGFDWHYVQKTGTTVLLDSNEYYGARANRSISITYTDMNDDPGLYQYVAAKPDTMYRLSAWVKSDDLQAANGPALGAVDAYDNREYATTDVTLGTTTWHEVWKDFKSGPETRLITIRILRNPANTAMRGRFWIDDVRMCPIRNPGVASK